MLWWLWYHLLCTVLNILHKDGGCGVNDSSTLLTVQPKRARKRKKRKKVLIISCFPEILRITSLFLNAVGISHELLMLFSESDVNESTGSSPLSSSLRFWTHRQQVIARFKKHSESSVSCDILVACPEVLGSMSLGLSASNAEVVVSLDKDWSGRSNLFIYSILMK